MKTRSVMLWIFLSFVFLAAAFGYATYKSAAALIGQFQGQSDEYDGAEGEVAILNVSGVIQEAETVLKDLRNLVDNKSVQAIVVRIDSPGGAVGPSQEIYHELLKLRKDTKLKIVCSMGDIAASGGYYIAAACEKIVANAGTLTGSIGVIMPFINARGLYDWAKLEPMTLKAGHFKDIGSESRPMRADEKALLEELLNNVHQTFKEDIQAGRPQLSSENLQTYADGRVFTGEQGLKLGFVDVLGGESVAIDEAAKMLGLKEKPKVLRKTDRSAQLRDFFQMEGSLEGTLPEFLKNLARQASPGGLNLAVGRMYLLPYHFFQSSETSVRSR